jgi:hypothetical protein
MKTIEYKTIDKSDWPRGPWDNEPDKMQWPDEATGLPCLVVRGPMGSWCGYVGIPSTHPAYGKEYSADGLELSAHGGLTFSDKCSSHTGKEFKEWREYMLRSRAEIERYPEGDAAQRWKREGHLIDDFKAWEAYRAASAICHTVEPGEDDCVWWFGFDCAHYHDLIPEMLRLRESKAYGGIFNNATEPYTRSETYRTIEYVRNECRELAAQLKTIV